MKTLIAALLLILSSVHSQPAAIGDAPLLLSFRDVRLDGDTYGGDIYIYDVERGTTRRLTTSDELARELDASIAPDRKHIVWTASNGTWSQLSVAALDDNGTFGDGLWFQNYLGIMTNANQDYFGSSVWSPCLQGNQGQLAFISSFDPESALGGGMGADPEIWIQDIPLDAWKPEELAFDYLLTESPLAVASAQTRRRITDNQATESGLAWSPDGKRIAYVTDISGSPDIYIQDTDGINKNIQRITSNEWDEQDPYWSSDGEWMIFSQRGDIHKMPIGLGLSVKLTNFNITVGRVPTRPVWSPDDQYIAFEHAGTIYLMLSDGSELHDLVTVNDTHAGYPAWVPLPRAC